MNKTIHGGGGEDLRAQKLFEELKAALGVLEQQHWRIGRVVEELKKLGNTLKQISTRVNYKPGTLSQFHRCWLAYGGDKQDSALPWRVHHLARGAADKVATKLSLVDGEKVEPDYPAALEAIAARHAKSPIKNPTDALDVLLAPIRAKIQQDAPRPLPNQLFNNVHHADCCELLATLPDWCAQLVVLDPPYAQYRGRNGVIRGGEDRPASVRCDNDNEASALEKTCGAVTQCGRILQKNGVALLFQSAGYLRIPIIKAIEDAGLEIMLPTVVWDKGVPMMGDRTAPWTYASEFIYVLVRKDDRLMNFDDSPRDNVIRGIGPTRYEAGKGVEPHHTFEKPQALAKYLIEKHSAEGQLVIDAFGCTGAFALAAANLSRKWVYCESNRQLFEIFSALLLKKVGVKS